MICFSKYVWVVATKDKKGVTILYALQNYSDNSKRKPYKIWVDQGSGLKVILSLKSFWKTITLKCIQHTMKQNLLLLKNLLEI